ncbi:putative DNA-binding protein (MmcQ/YjbR family) [Fontibacillus phaseoli]|uniref:Putative DNA-binding protein (MmcQ/YjbR family) n=1 Tax=Fontibacillus phaseoli TaxID=1416533 RepID=A0A369B9R2_9BACL|nr:MmcQ/YjbR family DNA-binding protein [Fontibacillus phaseoli]RCX16424.1 putative DNA-binding protein (MmcQ/YjbR family) [Fontibacillus phaseoli]
MYKKLVSYCLSKKGAVEEYPFGPDPLVMKVGGKMFALITVPGKQDATVSISLKCDPVIAANLREQHECVLPGYHLNKTHWNTVVADGSLPMADMQAMIDHSYELVLGSLTRAAREAVLQRIGG